MCIASDLNTDVVCTTGQGHQPFSTAFICISFDAKKNTVGIVNHVQNCNTSILFILTCSGMLATPETIGDAGRLR